MALYRCVPAIVEPPPRWNLLKMLFWCCCVWGGASVSRRHAVECVVSRPLCILATTIRLRLPRAPGDASSYHSVHSSVLCAARKAPVSFQLRIAVEDVHSKAPPLAPRGQSRDRPLAFPPRRLMPPTTPAATWYGVAVLSVPACAVAARWTSRAPAADRLVRAYVKRMPPSDLKTRLTALCR